MTIDLDDFAPLLEAQLPAQRYYGYYHLYQYYNARNDEENKLKTPDILNGMKKSVSKFIVDDIGL